jgi:hypothetical protein
MYSDRGMQLEDISIDRTAHMHRFGLQTRIMIHMVNRREEYDRCIGCIRTLCHNLRNQFSADVEAAVLRID